MSAASPLHIAASSIKAAPGRLACAARLLEAGADARLLDEDGDALLEKLAAWANSAGKKVSVAA